MKVKIGCDPEIFVVDKDGNPISMHDKVPGTKKNPHKLKRGAVQADGTAMEFNTEPADTPEEFVTNIKSVLRQLKKYVPENGKMHFSPTVVYDPKYFESLPDTAKELGCDPDYNAYKGGMANPRPNNRTTMRTASGHIHIGWTSGVDIRSRSHLWDCMEVVRALDERITPLRTIWDYDTRRAQMYGKPGCFRPKPYGVEWRTPSNAWLNHPELWPWLFKSIQAVMNSLEKGEIFYKPTPLNEDLYDDKLGMYRSEYRKKCINNHTDRLGLPPLPIDAIAKRMGW